MYGKSPEDIAEVEIDLKEFVTYLYLPIKIPGSFLRVPRRLTPIRPLIKAAMMDQWDALPDHFASGLHIYLTVKRNFASPGNPLNRPGWHCDGFGTEDINYIWTDAFPTRIWEGDPRSILSQGINPSHVQSLNQFETLARSQPGGIREIETNTLVRLDPYVIHTTPEIPAPGGMRTFVKISFSRHRYNLEGNSHNYLIDYDWEMHPRDVLRNDPARAGLDFYDPS